jgi:hypothetical protein
VVRWVDRLGRNYEDVCDTIRDQGPHAAGCARRTDRVRDSDRPGTGRGD